MGSEISVLKAS